MSSPPPEFLCWSPNSEFPRMWRRLESKLGWRGNCVKRGHQGELNCSRTGVSLRTEGLDTDTNRGTWCEGPGRRPPCTNRGGAGTDPSFVALKRNRPCQHVDLRLSASWAEKNSCGCLSLQSAVLRYASPRETNTEEEDTGAQPPGICLKRERRNRKLLIVDIFFLHKSKDNGTVRPKVHTT